MRVGHVTFRSSATVSRRYLLTGFPFFCREAFFATRLLLRITRRLIVMASCLDQAGQVGLEPTTPGFGDRCSAKLSYWPRVLLGLPVQRMFPLAGAVLHQLDPSRIVPTTLFGRVIPFITLSTLQRNDRSTAFFSHLSTYSRISVIAPAPTVRPPSRIANRLPFSSATGVRSSTVRFTLSPGITISTPSGSSIVPVTSRVRM